MSADQSIEPGRVMPIQIGNELGLRFCRGERVVIVRSIPWEMIGGPMGERQAQRNHEQSLDELASRAGLSACEAICIIACMPWQKICEKEEDAHRILYAMRTLFNRGKLLAESASTQGNEP